MSELEKARALVPPQRAPQFPDLFEEVKEEMEEDDQTIRWRGEGNLLTYEDEMIKAYYLSKANTAPYIKGMRLYEMETDGKCAIGSYAVYKGISLNYARSDYIKWLTY